MRSLKEILEIERAAGQCDLDVSPSGKAMHDRVWARTQASIADDRGDKSSATSEVRAQVLTWGRRTILFAALVLGVSPSEGMRGVETNGVGAAVEGDVRLGATVPREANLPSQASPAATPRIDVVSINELPTALMQIDAPSPAPVKMTRAASPKPARSARPSASPPGLITPPSPDESDQLDLERRLLDRVRHALAARDYAGAGAVLGTYETTFHDRQLGEEAEALKIRWLAASGDGAAARAMATRFMERFPTSLFRPSVETALRTTSQEGKAP